MPSSALGNAGQSRASERIGLAFIGPGGRGTQLVREFAGRPEVGALAVCDVHGACARRSWALIERWPASAKPPARTGAAKTYVDFREVLARDDIDAVVISAPEHWRAIMCIMAAKAGKDIFTEKPFSLTIKEGQAMVEAIRRYGRIFQHGTQRRSNNEWQAPRLVRDGAAAGGSAR